VNVWVNVLVPTMIGRGELDREIAFEPLPDVAVGRQSLRQFIHKPKHHLFVNYLFAFLISERELSTINERQSKMMRRYHSLCFTNGSTPPRIFCHLSSIGTFSTEVFIKETLILLSFQRFFIKYFSLLRMIFPLTSKTSIRSV
jgi:hypothetical protein